MMSALKDNKSCVLLEQYLSYLMVIKGRSPLTAIEYRNDLNMFWVFVKQKRNPTEDEELLRNFSDVDIDFIKSITISDIYEFITYCGQVRKVMTATRLVAKEMHFCCSPKHPWARKIISIRQFWKYLKTKAHLLDDNIAEELESPKLPKRMPKYLTLEESIRLLIVSENNPRDYCILTVFLNCALRLSELVNLDLSQVESDSMRIVGKGDRERRIFLTPATKKTLVGWLEQRKSMESDSKALFITKLGSESERNRRRVLCAVFARILGKKHERVTSRGVQDIVKKYLKKAGFDGQGYSTHKLRHTSCTLMYRYGLSLSAFSTCICKSVSHSV